MFRIILKLLWENVYQVSFTCALYDVEEFFTDYHWLSLFQVLLQGLVTSATRLCRTIPAPCLFHPQSCIPAKRLSFWKWSFRPQLQSPALRKPCLTTLSLFITSPKFNSGIALTLFLLFVWCLFIGQPAGLLGYSLLLPTSMQTL